MKKLEKSVPVIRFKGFSDAWEQRKLGDITESFSGGTPQAGNSDYYGGEIPFIRSGEINDEQTELFITDEGLNNSSAKIVEKGDILYALYGATSGEVGISQINGAINQAILAIRPTKDDNSYLIVQWLLKQKEAIIRTYLQGGQGNLSSSIVKELTLMLPKDKTEQAKIGVFFKQLDDTIALHQRKLDTLKLMKKAFSQQIFPENNRKKPKIRFTSFYEEWEQRKIGEYGYFYYGKSAPKWSVAQDATTPCVRYGELYTKFGPEIDIVHSYTNIDKSNLKFSSGNEVLVPRVGENPLDFANCSWLSISNVAIGEMISVYNTEQYPLFIAYYFRSKMKYEFAKRVEGGNVSNLYYSYLEDILISVPSIEEQKKIAEFLNKIDITINLLQNKLGRIKELKKAYLQNMFI
ncbi:restriction endonuclease subunit S [Listeria innocua]|nr:restriction endonuclease subunit S [Listeria innocua]ELY0484841.1 restriction endonuclease subunit S [Listeria innocua]ELY0493656.1 restriction endonuclease subunit S [Listeria innocua]